MIARHSDNRSPARKAKDEEIAAEPQLLPVDLPADAVFSPIEAHLGSGHSCPIAVAGIVENGVVRPLDPAVKLREQERVIIVAAE